MDQVQTQVQTIVRDSVETIETVLNRSLDNVYISQSKFLLDFMLLSLPLNYPFISRFDGQYHCSCCLRFCNCINCYKRPFNCSHDCYCIYCNFTNR